MMNQIVAFESTPVNWIHAIDKIMKYNTRKDNSGIAILDFDEIREKLIEYRAIREDDPWYNPSEDDIESDIHKDLPEGFEILSEDYHAELVANQKL